MKPIPAQKIIIAEPVASEGIPSLPSALPPTAAPYSAANRRTPVCAAMRIYPWLLAASTATAAAFCLLYITKPVIIPAPAMIAPLAAPQSAPQAAPPPAASVPTAPASPDSLLPGRDELPGEQAAAKPIPSDPRSALPTSPAVSPFEETNLRVQHVLTAEAPGGHLDRIILDVPVLYQSRHLRWTPPQVAEARELLVRLMDHQEKTQFLRAQGVELLDAWNRLIEGSIPAGELRADSPSLPANQQDAANAPRPSGLLTTESVKIQPAGK